MKKTLILTLFVILGSIVYGQTDTIDNKREKAIKVFIDCDFCDIQYIKDNITFVNYVRDHHDAEVYIFIVTESAGNGGIRYTLIFSGQKRFINKNDTLRFTTKADATSDENRTLLNKYLKLGLTQYVIHSPLIDDMHLKYNAPIVQNEKIVEDKWHSWVFDLSTSMYMHGESSYKNINVRSGININKITPDWKIRIKLRNSYRESEYVITDDYTVKSINRSNSMYSLVVKSINDHWSVGSTFSSGTSTYSNYDLYVRLKPGIEYDLFPYSESTIRQLTTLYTIGIIQNYYTDTTIYNKTEELLFQQSLQIAYAVKKKWGSIDLSVSGSNYLHDFTKNSFSFSGSISWRIAKGLSLFTSGNISIIHDQLNLAKGNASVEEILLRQHQISTQYSYFASFGISYTFGSKFNNVVNPRFTGGGGGGYVIYF